MAKTLLLLLAFATPVIGHADDAQSREAYRKTLYTFFEEKGCVRCHDGQKRFEVSGPAFASADFAMSYRNVRRYIRFSDIGNSWLVKKGGGGHWLNDYGYDCKTNGDEIAAAITAWWEGGERENLAPPKVTQPIVLPPAATNSFTNVAWDLSEISGVPQSRLEMEVHASAGTYLFRNPRLHAGHDAVQIQGLSILVNGKESPWRNRYRQLSRVINADPLSEGTLLTTEIETVPARDGQNDSLTLQFAHLEPGKAEGAKQVNAFKQLIAPIIEARQCTHCHHQQSKLGWRFGESAETLARQTLQRVNRESVEKSPWLTLPARGEAGHPVIFTEDDYSYVLKALKNWIAQE